MISVIFFYYNMVVLLSDPWPWLMDLSAEAFSSKFLNLEQGSSIVYQDHNATRTQAPSLFKTILKDTNKYFLYTRLNINSPQELHKNDLDSIKRSHYNSADQTIFIVHGWNDSWQSDLNPTIKDAFLDVIYANVIVVDWSVLSSRDYVVGTETAPHVGKLLGQFLQFLHLKAHASYNTMHLVGFDVGAHVVGNAASSLQPNAHIARITGLDPAGPLWEKNSKRLKAEDAVYVEAIHTDGGLLGTTIRCGDVDFYPNGGTAQPGCSLNVRDSCSHIRSWQLFAATVKFNHLTGRRCAAESALGLNMCYQDYLPMGNDDLLKKGSGVYRLTTGPKYPYPQLF